MRFKLYYRGGLPSNGRPNQKWQLRRVFSEQLDVLWHQEPLIQAARFRDPDYNPNDCYLGETRNEVTYFPIASEKIFTVAELDILMLRPGLPGAIAMGGGDIDNRLKTLFDSLQPPNPSDTFLPCDLDKSKPVSCLLQDDKLITRVNVETDRLLEGCPNDNQVILIVGVHIRASSGRMCNLGIAT